MKKTDEQCVKDWIAGLNEGSKNYAVYVLALIEWGKAEERWQSGEDMLNRWKRLRRGRNEDTRERVRQDFPSLRRDQEDNDDDFPVPLQSIQYLLSIYRLANVWRGICMPNIGRSQPDLRQLDRAARVGKEDVMR